MCFIELWNFLGYLLLVFIVLYFNSFFVDWELGIKYIYFVLICLLFMNGI